MIIVYADDGVGPMGLAAIKTQLAQRNFAFVERTFFDQKGWDCGIELLIMPGGRDLPYCAALNGKRCQSIVSYVEAGGAYLGICAGAYFGAASIEFERGSPLEVVGKRELGFFPGVARGPAYGNGFCYESERGMRQASLHLSLPDLSHCHAYFNGGCLFAGDSENTAVIGRYADLPDQPAAIVKCNVGKGTALLSGVHPEYDARLFHSLLADLA